MSKVSFLAVLVVGVLCVGCGGQPSSPVEGDQTADDAAQADTEKVFDDSFETGKTDEWVAKEGAAATTTTEADQ